MPTQAPTSDSAYRGMQTGYGLLTLSVLQTIQSYGGTLINVNGCPYSTFLPNPVTSPSQISSSLFATLDTYAAWAQTYKIEVGFTFAALSDTGWSATPTWMLNLAGGSGAQLEYDYFTGNSAVSTVAASITCLWQAMATRYANNPYVYFDFFNEPFYPGTLVTKSNYRTLEADYSSVITSLTNAVRTINPDQEILVDAPFMVYYDINYGTVPVNIPNIVWDCHSYVTSSISLSTGYNSWEHYYIDGYVKLFVTDLGMPLFIGEYGYYDNNGMELDNFVDSAGNSWHTILSSQVAYMKTLPLWGYQWNSYPWLYGQQFNAQYAAQGYSTYTSSDSTWILTTVL